VIAAGLALFLLATPQSGEPTWLNVRVVREGVAVPVSRPATVASLLRKLVEGASVNSTSLVQVEARWSSAVSAASLVHVRFSRGQETRVRDSSQQRWNQMLVTEILLAVPRDTWPDNILLKSDSGLTAVTKYSPCAMAELMQAADLAALDQQRKRYGNRELLCGPGASGDQGAVEQ